MVGIDSHLGRDMQNSDTYTPIHRMPVELLAEIFMNYIGASAGGPGRKSSSTLTSHRDSEATPFLLGRVCTNWRSITLSTPTLWSSLHILRPTDHFVSAVECWLDRAGTCPLSLTLHQSYESNIDEKGATDRILITFIQRIDRWKKIDFYLSELSRSPLLHISQGMAKILESAKLKITSWEFPDMDLVWRSLHASPSLSEIEWDGGYIKRMPKHVPWVQLTHITPLCNLNIETLLQVLNNCPQIVSLDIYRFLPSHPLPATLQNSLTLSRLRKLKIYTKTSLRELWNRLTLPALVNLDIQNIFSMDIPRNFSALQECLVRSSCHLEEFTLTDYRTEDDILQCISFPCLVTLKKLQLCSYLTDKTIAALTLKDTADENRSLLPNLESMFLHECHTSDGALSSMISSRFKDNIVHRPNGSLKSVTVYLHQRAHAYPHDLLYLESMQKIGLQLQIVEKY